MTYFVLGGTKNLNSINQTCCSCNVTADEHYDIYYMFVNVVGDVLLFIIGTVA